MAIERVELPAKSRKPRAARPRYIIIHTTQGVTTVDKQYSATVNWMKQGGAQGELGTWGPACDILIGHDGREAWFTSGGKDYRETRSNWSAGYGASSTTTYGADEYGIAIEIAQTSAGEVPPAAALRAAAARCASLCGEYGIEVRRIPSLSQGRVDPIPSGLVGHEDTANGIRTGKWDPNKRNFPWDWFIARVKSEMGVPMSNAYIVVPGDNLSKIAQRVGQTVTVLAQRNAIADPNRIEVGQVLRLADDVPQPINVALVHAVKRELSTVAAAVDRARGVLDGGAT